MKNGLVVVLLYSLTLCGLDAQVFEWAGSMGSTVQDEGHAVTTDASGNVYTVGNFRYSADFDPGSGAYELSTPAGDADIFVQKLDEDGKFVWAKQLGGTGWEGARSVAVDNASGIYVVGNFNGTADFNPEIAESYPLTAVGGDDIFIVKLSFDGKLIWAKNIGGATTDEAYGVTTDGSGNIYVTGRFQGTADFNPGGSPVNLVASGGSDDIFLCKYDADGNLGWAKNMGAGNNDFGLSVKSDASGNAYITGYFNGSVDFDPGNGTTILTAPGTGSDIFIAKYNSAGNFVWAKSFGSNGWDVGYDIAVDAGGNIAATGRFEGTVDFDPGAAAHNISAVDYSDIYLVKLDENGDFLWAHGFGSTFSEWGQGIDLDASGNVYFTGYFQNSVDFDPGSGTSNLISNGSEDAFVSKFDGSGNFIWAKSMGCNDADFGDRGQDIDVDVNNSVITIGWFYGTADFDPGANLYEITPVGNFDVFVQKLSQPGVGVGEGIAKTNVHLYPNPTDGAVNISVGDSERISRINIIDAAGRAVEAGVLINHNKAQLELQGNEGIYFGKIQLQNGETRIVKMVKM
ncbi:MAG: SBBP repeat-containing protein [Saprospiraceae bacterium]|nr:MAG: PDK repeat-containing protein [Candidatus Parvibacillus calidus]MCC7150064.1 SBBP repeat-containing protein [Saprospiraceae bacterium]MCO6462173.1 SBBP repeat-containing protein [Saprospiraceae bacterium]